MELSIIIVSYNTKDLTLEAIDSVYRETKEIDFEVIVLDNDSKDGSAEAVAEKYPQVTLIRSLEIMASGRAIISQRNRLVVSICFCSIQIR